MVRTEGPPDLGDTPPPPPSLLRTHSPHRAVREAASPAGRPPPGCVAVDSPTRASPVGVAVRNKAGGRRAARSSWWAGAGGGGRQSGRDRPLGSVCEPRRERRARVVPPRECVCVCVRRETDTASHPADHCQTCSSTEGGHDVNVDGPLLYPDRYVVDPATPHGCPGVACLSWRRPLPPLLLLLQRSAVKTAGRDRGEGAEPSADSR